MGSTISATHLLALEEDVTATTFQRRSVLSCSFVLFRMREILEFSSTGKGVFALRKSLKVSGGVKLSFERDDQNVKGVTPSVSLRGHAQMMSID